MRFERIQVILADANMTMQISEHIVRLVAFLKRDESAETRNDDADATEPAPDSDDEDNQIMEI